MMGHTGFGDQHIPGEKIVKTNVMMFEKKINVTETVCVNRKGLLPSINKKKTNKNALVAVRSEQLLSIS